MSEVDGSATTVATDDVAVEKSYEFDRYRVPAVRLSVRSGRAGPATVQLSDPLPAGVSGTDVGLHADHGSDAATVAEGAVRLEIALEAEETFTAVYGIRNVAAGDLPGDPPAPEVSVRAAEGATESSANQPTDSPAAASRQRPRDGDHPGGDPSEANASGAASPASEPVADALADATESGKTGTGPASSGSSRPVDGTESLAAALAAEIRAGEADEADLAALRDALDVERGGSTEARARDGQGEVADRRRATDDLEMFLDQEGALDQFLGPLQADVERLDGTVASVTDRLSDHEDELSAVERDVEAVRTDVAVLHTDLEELRGSLEAVQGRLETVAETGVNREDDLDATRKRVTDLAERLEDGLDRLDGRVTDAVAEMELLHGEVSDAHQEIPDSLADRLAALEDDVDALAAAVDEVAAVQARLASVFADGTGEE